VRAQQLVELWVLLKAGGDGGTGVGFGTTTVGGPSDVADVGDPLHAIPMTRDMPSNKPRHVPKARAMTVRLRTT
jgi:hypothetical protein